MQSSNEVAASSAARRTKRSLFQLQAPISRRLSTGLAVAGLVSVLVVWSLLTYTGLVDPFFLPSPSAVAAAFYDLLVKENFLADIWASSARILGGFAIAAVLAIPVGVAIGAFKVVQAVLEPIIGAVRYMPASAFIPLLIIWLGIGESEKVSIIVIGVFFPLALLVADVASNTPREYLNISYTLGASRWQAFLRVFLRNSLPGIMDLLRIAFGWAWTYLIVAELVAASKGIGYVILTSSRFQSTDKIMAGVITIGALGLATDVLFRVLYNRLFPYAERVAAR
jgi:NitT/TauT family transport system permease protein